MAEQLKNSLDRPTSTLAAGISAVDVALSVQATHGGRLPGVGEFRLKLTDANDASLYEIMLVGSIAGDVCSDLIRGVESANGGGAARAFNAGDKVDLVLSAGALAAYAVSKHPTAAAPNVIIPSAGDVMACAVQAHAAQSVSLERWRVGDVVAVDIRKDGELWLTPVGTGTVNTLDKPTLGILARERTYFGIPVYVGWNLYHPDWDPSWSAGGFAISAAIWKYGANYSAEIDLYQRAEDGHGTGYGYFSATNFYCDDWDDDLGVYVTGWAQISRSGLEVGGPGGGDYLHRLTSDNTIGLFGVAPVAQQTADTIAELWAAQEAYGLLDVGSTAPDPANLVPGASRVLGPFPFAFDDAGLEDGIAFYTPTVGDVLLNAWIEIETAFDGTDPYAEIGTFVGSNTGLFYFSLDAANISVADGEWSGAGLKHGGTLTSVEQNQAVYATTLVAVVDGAGPSLTYVPNPTWQGTRGVPLKFSAANPLKIVVSQSGEAGGTAVGGSAGAGAVYLVVATPSLT